MKKGTKVYLVISTIFGVIGAAALIYQGVCFVFKKIYGDEFEALDDCDCEGDDEISNDDFFEEEGYFDD